MKGPGGRSGLASGWAAGLFFATSPGVVVIAVEIRAYPLFLLGAAASFYILVRLAGRRSRRGRRGGPAGPGILADGPRRRAGGDGGDPLLRDRPGGRHVDRAWGHSAWSRRWRPGPIVCGRRGGRARRAGDPAVRPVFAREARGRPAPSAGSSPWNRSTSWSSTCSTTRRMMVNRPVEAGVLAGAAVLAVAGIAVSGRPGRASWPWRSPPGWGPWGFAQLTLARVNFSPTTPNYSLWMKPGLCLFLAAGLSNPGTGDATSGRAGGGPADRVAVGRARPVGRPPRHFAHGPHRAMADLIRDLGPGQVAVVHDDPAALGIHLRPRSGTSSAPALEQFRSRGGNASGRDGRALLDRPPFAPSRRSPTATWWSSARPWWVTATWLARSARGIVPSSPARSIAGLEQLGEPAAWCVTSSTSPSSPRG